jgi:hypothetical protein
VPRKPRKLQRHSRKTETPLPGTAQISRLKSRAAWCLSSSSLCVCVFCVFHVVRKVDEATNFAFVQLTEQQSRLYENSHPQGQSGFGVGRNFSLHEGN